MKKLSILIGAIFMTSFAFAQVPTLHDPNAKVTVTPEQIAAWGAASQQGAGSTIVLDFEGCANAAPIGNYYNGGGGPNHGVYFDGNTLGLIDLDAGGSGNFANEPTPSTIMFFTSSTSSIMNVTAGFTTGFSFFYTSNGSGTVMVYDGLSGTGNLLATQTFPANYNLNCTGDPGGDFCHWDPMSVAFSGTAKSVVFSGVAGRTGFDSVTFGSITPGGNTIPTLTEWGLIFLGISLLAFGTFYIVRMKA